MKTDLDRPLTFFVVGMPRGGTTIVARVFDSLEDGFCLGEPHWYWYTHDKDMAAVNDHCTGGQVRLPESLDDMGTFLWIAEEVKRNPAWNLGGYKETWSRNNPLVKPITNHHKDFADFFVVVFRDPVMVHSSQVALGWKERPTPRHFRRPYRELDALAKHPRAVPVVLEDFVAHPLDYLNDRLPFHIEGGLYLRPTGHTYGDPYANRCACIAASDREVCIPPHWIEEHKEAREIWQRWRQS